MDKRRELRILSPHEQQQVEKLFRCMSVIIAKQARAVLARNRFVDATIAELAATVPDELVLLTAWGVWVASKSERALSDVLWPLSQFQTALPSALVIAQDDVAHYRKFASMYKEKHRADEPVALAARVLGGAA
jgi:hypothetical protein